MAHNIAKLNGKDAMWCVGDRAAAWHNLGQRTMGAQNWQEAMKLAGLDWTVAKHQLMGAIPGQAIHPVDSWGIFRESDGAFLGAVGRSYQCIQNEYAFSFVDVLLEAEQGAHYESAGALGDGSRIWTLARVPYDIRIAGTDDHSRVYLLFTTSHDGSEAAICKLSTVRVVCMNTLNAALSDGRKAQLNVRHSKNAEAKLDEAKRLMKGIGVDIKSLEEKLNALAERRMTRETLVAVLDRLFPTKEDPSQASVTRRENVLTSILNLYESNDKNGIPQIRGTAYNLLNAITEYTDHERDGLRVKDGVTPERARAEAAIFGTSNDLKTEALEVIMETTKGAPTVATKRAFFVPKGAPVTPTTNLIDQMLAHA